MIITAQVARLIGRRLADLARTEQKKAVRHREASLLLLRAQTAGRIRGINPKLLDRLGDGARRCEQSAKDSEWLAAFFATPDARHEFEKHVSAL